MNWAPHVCDWMASIFFLQVQNGLCAFLQFRSISCGISYIFVCLIFLPLFLVAKITNQKTWSKWGGLSVLSIIDLICRFGISFLLSIVSFISFE